VPSDLIAHAGSAPAGAVVNAAPNTAVKGHSADFEVIKKREEEPTAATPITYREYAYRVERGTARAAVEALLWKCFREIAGLLEARPKGKFVQLAVFDHAFEGHPLAPALATLSWKDWRGDPVLDFPAYTHATLPQPQVVERELTPAAVEPEPEPIEPEPVEPEPDDAEPIEPELEVAQPPHYLELEPASAASGAGSASGVPSSGPAVLLTRPKTDSSTDASSSVTADVNDFELLIDTGAAPPLQAGPASAPAPVAAPPAPAPRRRQRSSEDLISELFETMHELHFMPDLISGAEFVLKVLHGALPCELTLVHIFDINTRQFVVVRASGAGSDKLLLHRTTDADPVLALAMRHRGGLRIDDAAGDPRFKSGRWTLSGVQAKHAVCGAVQQQGRYLGAVELVNPLGGGVFSQSELNALDYICGQFADFVASRPIITDPDVVLAAPRV
jgi:hypothetical protein